MTRLELAALRRWHRLPRWMREKAPLPIVEWAEGAQRRFFADLTLVITSAFDALSKAVEQGIPVIARCSEAFEQLGDILTKEQL